MSFIEPVFTCQKVILFSIEMCGYVLVNFVIDFVKLFHITYQPAHIILRNTPKQGRQNLTCRSICEINLIHLCLSHMYSFIQ